MKKKNYTRNKLSGMKVIVTYLFLFVLLLIGITESIAQGVSQVFNYTTAGAAQIFTVPVGVTSITVGCWGGGGGAGGANYPSFGSEAASGGGGGGAYAESTLTGLVPGTTYTVTVGGGGTGGAAGNHPGGNGGTSSFGGNVVVAVGGGASLGANNGTSGSGGAGGLSTACTGTIVYSGGAGAAGSAGLDGGGGGGGAGNGGNGTAGAVPTGGAGGIGAVTGLPSSPGGAGGAGVYNLAAANAGLPIGGGGGGNDAYVAFLGSKSVPGGAGANGEVIISYIAPAPVITSVSGNGCVGTSITITGTNLIGANPVTIGGTPVSSITSVTSTQIVAVIAPGSSGIVSVTTPSGTATSSGSFTVNPAPAIPGNPSSNSPQCVSPGPGVTLTRPSSPPAGETFYWETTATGTSTAISTATYNVTTSGTYYIVAQDNTTGCWSLGAGSTAVIINTLPTVAITPSPATGLTGVCYGGSGASDIVSWAAVSNATSYDVYFGTGSVPATVTANVPSPNYYTGTLLPSTTYFWKVVPKNSCGIPAASPATWSFTTGATPCYCTSASSTSGSDGIVQVVFNTINNSTGLNSYTDYTASQSTTVNNGSTYQLSVFVNTNTTSTNTYTNYQKAWIDWNQNGVFDVPSEEYNLGTVYNNANGNSSLCPLNITVPAGALTGSTRMRVSSSYGQYSTPCLTTFDGEVEDYKIIVAAPPAPTITSFAPSTACPGNSITINGTNLYGITPSEVTIGGVPVSSITSTTGTVLVAVVGNVTSGTFPVIVTTGGGTATSGSSITTNPSPSLSLSPTSSQFCNPGTGVSLTASGSSTSYAWLPSGAGLSALTGATVTASPTATTTYTVTGTDGNGCTATTTTTITSEPTPTLSISPATPPTLCLGNVQPLILTSTTSAITLYSENFNGNFNSWTKINNSSGGLGTPANSAWLLTPNGYQYSIIGTTTFHSNDNSQFYLTNCTAIGLGNASTQLISPVINTSGFSTITLTFHDYLAYSSGTANVDISTNGGTTWTTIQSYTSNQGTSSAFATANLNLNAYVNQAIQIRFFFTSSASLFPTANWWAVDNVSFTGTPNLTYGWSPTSTLYSDAGATALYAGSNSSTLYAKPTGTTTYTTTVTNGYCSNTANVTINVLPVLSGSQTLSGCAGFSVTVGTNVHTTTGVYTDTIPAFGGGCDSVVTTNLTVGSSLTPGPISGNTTVCSSTTQTYSISPVAGATSYTWTLPGTWTGSSITNSISATTGASAGTISVTANSSCGSSPPQTLIITLSASLPTPGPISGNTTVCGGTPQTYYISPVSGATSYTWTLPGTWSGTSSTDSISPSIGASGGTISVVANGGCGTSASQTLTVGFGNPPAQPSSILGVTHLCDSSSTAYAVTLDATATSYTWTLPNGWTGTSNTNTITATASTASGTISVTANNGCGPSAASTLSVVGSTIPVVTVASFGTVCDNVSAFTLTGGNPTGGTYTGTGVNSNMFDPTIAGDGTYYITYTYSSGACVRSDSSTITVDLCIGIASNSDNQNITIYPNPSTGIITIAVANAANSELLISVADIQGREVYSTIDKNIVAGYTKQINLEQLAKGIYYIKLTNGENVKYNKLIIE